MKNEKSEEQPKEIRMDSYDDAIIAALAADTTITINYDSRKYAVVQADFKDIEQWLRTKSDGSIMIDFSQFEIGRILLHQNPAQHRTTTLNEVERKIIQVIRQHSR